MAVCSVPCPVLDTSSVTSATLSSNCHQSNSPPLHARVGFFTLLGREVSVKERNSVHCEHRKQQGQKGSKLLLIAKAFGRGAGNLMTAGDRYHPPLQHATPEREMAGHSIMFRQQKLVVLYTQQQRQKGVRSYCGYTVSVVGCGNWPYV